MIFLAQIRSIYFERIRVIYGTICLSAFFCSFGIPFCAENIAYVGTKKTVLM